MTLLQHAEDDYSTLLHLERVLNMRECGDHHGGGDGGAAPVSPAHTGGGQSRRRGHPEGGPFSMDLSDKSSKNSSSSASYKSVTYLFGDSSKFTVSKNINSSNYTKTNK